MEISRCLYHDWLCTCGLLTSDLLLDSKMCEGTYHTCSLLYLQNLAPRARIRGRVREHNGWMSEPVNLGATLTRLKSSVLLCEFGVFGVSDRKTLTKLNLQVRFVQLSYTYSKTRSVLFNLVSRG